MFFRPFQVLEFNGRASTCGCLGRHRGWNEFICESDLSSREQRMVTIILNASLYVRVSLKFLLPSDVGRQRKHSSLSSLRVHSDKVKVIFVTVRYQCTKLLTLRSYGIRLRMVLFGLTFAHRFRHCRSKQYEELVTVGSAFRQI